jgi:lysophospholipase L1-like esterase
VKQNVILRLSAFFGLAALGFGLLVVRGGWPPAGYTRPHDTSTFDPLRHYEARQALFEAETSDADIIMLGDSLIEVGHWTELLPGKVANRGIGGDTSKGVLNRLEQVLKPHPSVVCLLIGTNDLLLGRAVEEITQTISSTVDWLQVHGASVVLTSVPFVGGSFPIHINSEVTRLNASLRNLAVSRGTGFVDLNELTAENRQLAREDTIEGLHLSNKAYKKWAAALRPVLQHLADASRR